MFARLQTDLAGLADTLGQGERTGRLPILADGESQTEEVIDHDIGPQVTTGDSCPRRQCYWEQMKP